MGRARGDEGAVLVLVAVSLLALLAVAALAIDLGDFRAHRRQLQTAADAAALAGAMQLPPFGSGANACSQADYYARQNTTLTSAQNLVVNANLDTGYCQILGSSVRVQPDESRVPYAFGKVLGFVNTNLSAQARARVVYLTRSNGLLPFGVEDLRPQTVTLTVDATGQQITLGAGGCLPGTTEGYPYWCGSAYVNSLPAGGSTVSVTVVDTSGVTTTWPNIGYLGSDRPLGASGITVKDVVLSPQTDPFLYYTSTSSPKTLNVLAHLTGVQNGDKVTLSYDGSGKTATLVSGTNADGVWSAQSSWTSQTTESATGQAVQVAVKRGNTTYGPVTAQEAYARDDGDILQQWTQDRHYVDPSLAANAAGRLVTFDVAFQVLVKGQLVTLKLGGGGAQGNSGNYQGLDLDTTKGSGACHGDTSGTPNTAEEVQYGACTPYSIGDPVQTQTGNFAGQVANGLDARIGSSPDAWTSVSTPPPPGDPRWMSLILVPPLTFQNCSGTCTTHVVGFGSFYVTDYGGSKTFPSPLKAGEVRGVFSDRPVAINQYSTTCSDPQGICLASVALMPWSG
jgi:Putative Flp pilus-assembly TadE/G-like